MPKRRKIIFICASTFLIVSVVALITLHATNVLYKAAYKNYVAPTPKLNSSWSKTQQDESGDLYVSPLGDDSNDGSKEHPFLSFDKAKQTVKSFDKTTRDKITICFLEGEYKDEELAFAEEDSGTENCQIIYKGIGEVVFNSGVYLNPSDFNNSSNYPEYSTRLSKEAKKHVKVLQLDSAPYNITKERLNKIYPIGTYNTAYAYKDYVDGPIYSEVFINKKRMNMARYPNSGFLKTDEVLFSSRDSGVTDQNGDPKGDVYRINDDLSNRIKSWKTLDDVWMSGFFMWDWADSTTPIGSFDKTTNELTTKYYSFFGARQGMPYYFFNILEELDSPGEYYFDRENMRLLIYENDDFANSEIQISLSTKNHVQLNANYVTLDNLQFSGNRANGISSYGNNHHITIVNCSFYNLAGTAIGMLGHDISIVHNEVHDVGKLGIDIHGGDKNSLTYSNNIIALKAITPNHES